MLAAAGLVIVMSACSASAPPAAELANELIDTLEENGVPLSDDVKACMHAKVDDFALTEEESTGFKDLSDVADKAADGNEQAKLIMARFQAELAACNP